MESENAEVRVPVTIIAAAIAEDDSVLIGCDSNNTEADTLRTGGQGRLRNHPAGPVAWSHAGNAGLVGHDFDEWLRSEQLPDNWDQLRDAAVRKLADLNDSRRHLVSPGGASPQPSDTSSCLLVGWLDTVEILELDETGKASYHTTLGFHAIGRGRTLFYAAFFTVMRYKLPGIDVEARLRLALDVACGLSRNRGRPVHIWRVSRNGIEDTSSPKHDGSGTSTNKPPAG